MVSLKNWDGILGLIVGYGIGTFSLDWSWLVKLAGFFVGLVIVISVEQLYQRFRTRKQRAAQRLLTSKEMKGY